MRRCYYLRCQIVLWKKHLCPFLLEQLGYALLVFYSIFSQKIKKLFKLESVGSLLSASLLGIVALGCSAGSRLWVSRHPAHRSCWEELSGPVKWLCSESGGCWQAGSRLQLLRSWAPRHRSKLALPLSPGLSLLAAKLQGLAS